MDIDETPVLWVDLQRKAFSSLLSVTTQRPHAPCRHQNYRWGDRFPHFMQQLTVRRCWSFCQSYPNHQDALLKPKDPEIFRHTFGQNSREASGTYYWGSAFLTFTILKLIIEKCRLWCIQQQKPKQQLQPR